ncbi:CsbD family protein [Agromyces sp. MMS24-JH15]|uniref:CsbD family protein n=1 Tax=Agromyces sp. MMS24-JH15 TaxID=3243765 RepID=UPI00374A62E3
MGSEERADATKDDVAGKAKEAWGKVTDDEKLEAEGKADQAKSDLKNAVEDVKDAFKH